MEEYHIVVKGLVQGVCFRALVKNRAKEYRLCGSVKNLKDGSVEIILQGSEQKVLTFLESLKYNSGAAKINDLTVSKTSSFHLLDGFNIL